MAGYALIDEKGWIDGVVITETGFDPKDYPCAGYVELGKDEARDEAQKIIQSQLTMFWDGEKFCQIKNPKDIWKRLRSVGFGGKSCEKALRQHMVEIDSKYPEVPSWMMVTSKTNNIQKAFNPSFECELLPGLKICLSDEDDLEIWESQMIESGLYTKDQAWSTAAEWLSDPLSWPIKTMWKDKVIQVEIYHFDLNNPHTVRAGFTDHIDRIRPLWFWKQLAKPVFKSLYMQGFESIRTSIREDEPNWIDFLKDGYGAEELGKNDSGIILRYHIKDSLQKIGNWPERKSLGADWSWSKDGVLVREATESDLIMLREAMDISWGDSRRKDMALEMLEDRWILDRAAILLGFYEDKIIDSLVIRERKDPTLNLTGSPLKWFPENQKAFDIAWEGFLTWQRDNGYKISSFITEAKLYNPVKDAWGTRGYKVYTEKSDIIEWRIDVEGELANRVK